MSVSLFLIFFATLHPLLVINNVPHVLHQQMNLEASQASARGVHHCPTSQLHNSFNKTYQGGKKNYIPIKLTHNMNKKIGAIISATKATFDFHLSFKFFHNSTKNCDSHCVSGAHMLWGVVVEIGGVWGVHPQWRITNPASFSVDKRLHVQG